MHISYTHVHIHTHTHEQPKQLSFLAHSIQRWFRFKSCARAVHLSPRHLIFLVSSSSMSAMASSSAPIATSKVGRLCSLSIVCSLPCCCSSVLVCHPFHVLFCLSLSPHSCGFCVFVCACVSVQKSTCSAQTATWFSRVAPYFAGLCISSSNQR